MREREVCEGERDKRERQAKGAGKLLSSSREGVMERGRERSRRERERSSSLCPRLTG